MPDRLQHVVVRYNEWRKAGAGMYLYRLIHCNSEGFQISVSRCNEPVAYMCAPAPSSSLPFPSHTHIHTSIAMSRVTWTVVSALWLLWGRITACPRKGASSAPFGAPIGVPCHRLRRQYHAHPTRLGHASRGRHPCVRPTNRALLETTLILLLPSRLAERPQSHYQVIGRLLHLHTPGLPSCSPHVRGLPRAHRAPSLVGGASGSVPVPVPATGAAQRRGAARRGTSTHQERVRRRSTRYVT